MSVMEARMTVLALRMDFLDRVVELERAAGRCRSRPPDNPVPQAELYVRRRAVPACAADARPDAAHPAAAAAVIGTGVGNVELPDVVARIGQARRTVGQTVQGEVARQRLPVELCLETGEALAARVQP